MSFSLTAVGTLDDVRQQLAVVDLKHGGDVAEATRALVAEKVLAGVGPEVHAGYEKRFVVKASGHADAYATSLNLTVETVIVAVGNQDDGEVSEAD